MTDDGMTDQDWDEITARWERLIRPLLRDRKYADAIELVQGWIESESKIGRRCCLLRDLDALLVAAGRYDAVLPVIRRRIDLDADDPINWCSLANWYSCGLGSDATEEDRLTLALEAIDMAVAKGRVQTDNLRQCLNDRCRIAVAMKRYDLLEESLREILDTRHLRGIQFEDDFLPRIPEGAVDPAVMDEYRALLLSQEAWRAKRRTQEAQA